MYRARIYTLFALVMGIFFAVTTHAQLTDDGVTVNVFPEYPGPYESVTISLTGYSANLDSSDIRWSENGKQVSGGVGKTDYTFTTKDVGVQTTITATITTPNSDSSTKRVVITPMGLDLLWEATDSIVPPLYRGKSQPAPGARVKFVALPNMKKSDGTFLGAQDLVYTWKHNYKTSGTGGYGKNAFMVTLSDLNPSEAVSVTAESRDKQLGSFKSMNLAPENPRILWYMASPLYGPQFESAVFDGHSISGNDVSLIALPFFFSPKDTSSSKLTYEWSINDNPVNTGATPNILFLHRDTQEKGGAKINVHITNKGKLFQEATSELQLELN